MIAQENTVSSWWTTAIGWKIASFCLAAAVALLGGGLYRATSAQSGVDETQMKRLAGQVLLQAEITHKVVGTVTAQSKTIDALTDGQLDLSRISVGLLRHEQETSPIAVRIAQPPPPGSHATRQLASVRAVSGWTLSTEKATEGGFAWPLHGLLSSRFGPRGGSFHPGLDIAVPYGTPIRAAAAGRVSTAGYSGGYGNFVVIQHDGAYSTAYGHQSRLAVHVGQLVAQGQVVGYVGTTGYSTGPHLHFEVRINGTALDPMGYLK